MRNFSLVMAGLVPAIHDLLAAKDVDARIRGHDEDDHRQYRSSQLRDSRIAVRISPAIE